MPAPAVWFNKYLANTGEVVARLRRDRRPGEFRVLVTHPSPRYRGRCHADHFELEPDGLAADRYVDYCLGFAERHGVALFFPGRNVLPVVAARDRFAAVGTRVCAAGDAATIRLVNHKAKLAAAVADVPGVRLPTCEVVTDRTAFDAAVERLRGRHTRVCYKPATGVYGIGFHVLDDFNHPNGIALADARTRLGAGRFADLLVMEYLPGPERSVDALAENGELVGAVVRRKGHGWQLIEDNPRLVEVVRRLAARLRLTGLFNTQFRDAAGEPHLLEINPRMSGGLPMTFRSGLNLPLWAVRLALGTGTAADLPAPRTGVRVPQPVPARST
ncbi:ATP-grasp domain-containing protein [Urbifossiella limnaea]|uniref:Carbamoyl phosphate synthase-like protein n=1 Tax=Urbifossiella limnaea TaxID=2528023 RepID=A0A517XPP7_9BACT|nr:ATP-grasp domain-containing protein [Urbifossiella limnaea]QDU19466.1 carbamoyl phosphate synthase-like protein [Urbifossiella limnaea]